jgi:polysaccharide export outer membrane protein
MRIKFTFYQLSLCLFTCILFNSCTAYKEVPLFRDLPQSGELKEAITNYSPLIVQKNDMLSIRVSSLNAEASALFNNPNGTAPQTSGGSQPGNQAGNEFLVNQNGEVQLPYIGKIHVAGLTTPAVTELVTEKLKDYLNEPVVNLKINNFRVAVFGGVKMPGIFTVNTERITVVEALILAGDLSVTSKRQNVLIVREIDGERKFARFDLGSKSTFDSPYFYLKTNDLIYVQPGTSEERRNTFLTGVGALSTVVSLILILTRL